MWLEFSNVSWYQNIEIVFALVEIRRNFWNGEVSTISHARSGRPAQGFFRVAWLHAHIPTWSFLLMFACFHTPSSDFPKGDSLVKP